ncbi:hypothetical protein BN2537_17325 [Streptomyces venezuelae]|nr:hypothetical protein BN2537_17325 [Streptomyces venezuelae]
MGGVDDLRQPYATRHRVSRRPGQDVRLRAGLPVQGRTARREV